MRVLMQGQVVDGPYSAETGNDSIAATFMVTDEAGRRHQAASGAPERRARCEVVCRGALALSVLLDVQEGSLVQVAGELRLSAAPGEGDLVLATLEAEDIAGATGA